MDIARGDSLYAGVKEDKDGNIVCERCGKDEGMEMIFHADAADYCISNYRCKCGNTISIRTERDEESKMMWG